MELIVRPARVGVGVGVMSFIVVMALALSLSFTTYAYDPSPLQNICVAVSDNLTSVFMNGKVCKNPKLVTADDFMFSGLQIAGNTNNPLGFAANIVDVHQLPGLNTLGVAIARGDFAPNGVASIHLHPRASEIILVLQGTFYVGFVDSKPGIKSRVFSKILKPGDVFVFPIGLIHFTQNIGNTNGSIIATFNSQDFGFIRIPGDVFGTEVPISADMLAKGFQLDKTEVEYLQSLAW